MRSDLLKSPEFCDFVIQVRDHIKVTDNETNEVAQAIVEDQLDLAHQLWSEGRDVRYVATQVYVKFIDELPIGDAVDWVYPRD